MAQRRAARMKSGSSAENNLACVQSKEVWKRGCDAGVIVLHGNLHVMAGSFRSRSLSCAERDGVACETGLKARNCGGFVC